MKSVNEKLISSHQKDEHIVALGALSVASANQVDILFVNENVSSCLQGEHIGTLGILGTLELGNRGRYLSFLHVSMSI